MSSSKETVIHTPGNDPAMEAAAGQARQTFRFFWRELSWERRRIVPGLELAAIKASFSDPPEIRAKNPGGLEVEYMWVVDVDFDGRQLYGTLINEPESLKSVKNGDNVTMGVKQLMDWMYVVFGQVHGGYTVDLLRSRMSKGERKQHDAAWGFDFGEVGAIQLVPPEYIGQPSARKKKWPFSMFAAKRTAQDPAVVGAQEHPMSVNMRESFEEQLSKNPGLLNEASDRGFTFLHQFALGGSFDGVDVCIKHGADVKRKTPHGMTAYTLAKTLGWQRIMKRLEEAGGA